jgi:glycosyltransferase involved in cell wall biosynthesis
MLKFKIMNFFTNKTIYVSKYLNNHFIKMGFENNKHVTVINNGINLNNFNINNSDKEMSRKKYKIKNTDFTIGCIGDIRPQKDYVTMLHTAKFTKDVLPSAKFIIAGSFTPLIEELMSLRKELSLTEEDVQFIGYQNNIRNFLSCIDIYLSTSISEGFSLTTIEAMAAGIPVISTKSGGPEEIISHNVNGLLAEVKSPESITEKIILLHNNRNFKNKLVAGAKEKVFNSYSIEKMIVEYQKLFNSILNLT